MISLIKYRVVVDTNVIISGAVFGGIPGKVFEAVRTEVVEWLMSPLLADEISTVLSRFSVSDNDLGVIQAMIRDQSVLLVPEIVAQSSRDPKDDMLLALALFGNADFLVTGDNDLLVLREFGDTRIITPREFLRVLGKKRGGRGIRV